jgi:hypothetical protein
MRDYQIVNQLQGYEGNTRKLKAIGLIVLALIATASAAHAQETDAYCTPSTRALIRELKDTTDDYLLSERDNMIHDCDHIDQLARDRDHRTDCEKQVNFHTSSSMTQAEIEQQKANVAKCEAERPAREAAAKAAQAQYNVAHAKDIEYCSIDAKQETRQACLDSKAAYQAAHATPTHASATGFLDQTVPQPKLPIVVSAAQSDRLEACLEAAGTDSKAQTKCQKKYK